MSDKLTIVRDQIRELSPGLITVATIAAAASFINTNLGGPVMLYALLIGLAFNFMMHETRAAAGVAFSAKKVLRFGVALLGVRLTFSDITGLGLEIVGLVILAVSVSIIFGSWIGRRMGMDKAFSVLSAGAVAICGASAALAIASVLPKNANSEKHTSLTVVAVTTLSTVVMVLYPVIVQALGIDDKTAGIFIGATIHDVAQVIGAGYIISDEAGQTSAIIKLMRVVCLMPVVLLLTIWFRKQSEGDASPGGEQPPLVPGFIIAFLLLIVLTSTGLIPQAVQNVLSDASRWCLVAAVAALGVKTSLGELMHIGPRPVLAMVYQTLFLAAFVAIGLTVLRAITA